MRHWADIFTATMETLKQAIRLTSLLLFSSFNITQANISLMFPCAIKLNVTDVG